MTKSDKAFNRAQQVLLKDKVDVHELEGSLKAVSKHDTPKHRALAIVLMKTIANMRDNNIYDL